MRSGVSATARNPYIVQYCSAVNMKNQNQKKLTAHHKDISQLAVIS